MPTPEIEEFARILVQHVRDAAIQSCDKQLQRNINAPVAKRWKEIVRGGAQEALHIAIPDIVDETVFYVLNAIDQELLKLTYSASNGKSADLSTQGRGELSGWYMGTDGWRGMYSKERFFDDFADLKDFPFD